MTEFQRTRPLPRRSVLAGAAALSAGALPAVWAGPASAAPGRPSGTVVRVGVSARGLSVTPSCVPAGPVRFAISTEESDPMAPGLIRLAPGVSADRYLADYAMATSTDPAQRDEGTRRIDREAVYLGGATVTSVSPLGFLTELGPGRYHLFNYMAANTPYAADSIRVLHVTGRSGGRTGEPPRPRAVLTAAGSGPRSRFVAPGELPARGDILVVNATDQTNEAIWLRLTPDATAADVRAFWAAVAGGTTPPKNVLLSQPEGIGALSPGRRGVLATDFPAGRYLITSFISDRTTGVKGVFEDFWKIVTLR